MNRPRTGQWLALLIPLALLGGALGSQYLGGLYPCEMCIWQRWPHAAAILLALAGLFARCVRLSWAAALAILVSGAIGAFHAGVEYHWWEGITACSVTGVGGSAADVMADILSTPLVRCDQAQWALWGVSLAGWNALFSIIGGGAVLWLTISRKFR